MALIMHAERRNRNVYKTLIVAEYVGVEVKICDNFKIGVSNKSPEFLNMNPLGQFPVLETPDGPLFESNAIARYVARRSSLFGSSPIEYGQIEQWIDFSSYSIDANLRRLILLRVGDCPYNKYVEKFLIAEVKRGLCVLNTYLESHTNFLVGDSVTLADIITTCNLQLGFQLLMPKSFTSEYPHVETYFWNMINQPNFSKIIGEFKQLDATLAFPSQKKPEC
ncbi:elongation factor 1-gamma 3-like [Rutidosis leptorrhynchoides]|uniref:elongation factor 1-gamma 3-like n=1 Tax=Rutidosis leptorrhynchoides TaxID=125765 RepID=UPI003A99AB36